MRSIACIFSLLAIFAIGCGDDSGSSSSSSSGEVASNSGSAGNTGGNSGGASAGGGMGDMSEMMAVSYTHLTLPTILRV